MGIESKVYRFMYSVDCIPLVFSKSMTHDSSSPLAAGGFMIHVDDATCEKIAKLYTSLDIVPVEYYVKMQH